MFSLGWRARRCGGQYTCNPDCHFPFSPQTMNLLLGEQGQRTFWTRQIPPGLQLGPRKVSGFLRGGKDRERSSVNWDFPTLSHKLTQENCLHPEPECWGRRRGGDRSWEEPGSSW